MCRNLFASLGLQPATGFVPRCHTWIESQCLPGFSSLTAPSPHSRDSGDSSPRAAHSQVFSTSQRAYANRSLRVCSTPQALRGLRPSESDPGSISTRFPALTPSPLSVSQGFHPLTSPCPHPRSTPAPLRAGILRDLGLLAPCGTGSPLRLQPTLEYCSRSGAFRCACSFTHRTSKQLSWPSRLQGSLRKSPRTLRSNPPGVSTPSGFTGDLSSISTLRWRPPSWRFYLMAANFLFNPPGSRGYCFPSGLNQPSPADRKPS